MPEWIHTLTVDASRDARRRVTGIGIVIQERTGAKGRGPILAQISEAHRGVTGGHDEAFAILRALEIARERSFTRIKVRWQGAGMAGEGLHSQILCLARAFFEEMDLLQRDLDDDDDTLIPF